MSPNLTARLERHLAAIAASTIAATCITHDAGAQIIYSGIVNIDIPANLSGVYLNVVTGGTSSLPSNLPGWDINLYGSSSLNTTRPPGFSTAGACVGSGTSYTNVPSLTLIDSTSTFPPGLAGVLTSDGTLNLNAQTNLIGIQFYNESASTWHYGWLRLSLGSTITSPRTIVDYAYESSGGIITPFVGGSAPTGIRAGEIPTPASFTLLAIPGLATLPRRRRI